MFRNASIDVIKREYERIRCLDAQLFRAIREVDDLREVMRIVKADRVNRKGKMDNFITYRALVKRLIEDRKECGTIINFTKKLVPKKDWEYLTKETMTYEKALEFARTVIDNGYLMSRVKTDDVFREEDAADVIMNQNSMSIRSPFATITEFDVMCDEDLWWLLYDGLNIDTLAYLLKKFAKHKKDLK